MHTWVSWIKLPSRPPVSFLSLHVINAGKTALTSQAKSPRFWPCCNPNTCCSGPVKLAQIFMFPSLEAHKGRYCQGWVSRLGLYSGLGLVWHLWCRLGVTGMFGQTLAALRMPLMHLLSYPTHHSLTRSPAHLLARPITIQRELNKNFDA